MNERLRKLIRWTTITTSLLPVAEQLVRRSTYAQDPQLQRPPTTLTAPGEIYGSVSQQGGQNLSHLTPDYGERRLIELFDRQLREFIEYEISIRGYDRSEGEDGLWILKNPLSGEHIGSYKVASGRTTLIDPKSTASVDTPTRLILYQDRIGGQLKPTTELVATRGRGPVFGLQFIIWRSNIQPPLPLESHVGGSFPPRLLSTQPESMSMANIISVRGIMWGDNLQAEMTFDLHAAPNTAQLGDNQR